jgi:hypothetical protein
MAARLEAIYNQDKMDAWLRDKLKAWQETTPCHEVTKADTDRTEPNPGMLQYVGEHQEVTKEEAAVMPVGGLRKRRRDRNLAAGRRQKPKGRIQASGESLKRLTVAGRKVTALPEWHGAKGTYPEKIVPEPMWYKKSREDGRRRQPKPECSKSIRRRAVEEPLCLREGRTEQETAATTGKYGEE